MHPIKYVWAARALVNKLFYGHIGNLTYMGKPCFVEGRKRIRIGSRTRIFPGIRMEAIGEGAIEIGNNVAIEQNCQINAAQKPLRIGNDVTIAGSVFITNVEHTYQNIDQSVMDQDLVVKDTVIGDGCFIGYGAVLQAGTTLGKHCIVGSGAVVRGDFPDGSVIVGVPARVVKQYDPTTGKWARV